MWASNLGPKTQPRSVSSSDPPMTEHNRTFNGSHGSATTAPRSILPHCIVIGSNQRLAHPEAEHSGPTGSPDNHLNFEHGPSTSWVPNSCQSNRAEELHPISISPFSDELDQDMNDFSFDEDMPFGPLQPANHGFSPLDPQNNEQVVPLTNSHVAFSSGYHTSHSVPTSHPIRKPLNLQQATKGLPEAPNEVITGRSPSGLQPFHASKYREAEVDDDSSDDQSTRGHVKTRRRVSSTAGYDPSGISVPSPNDQAEERLQDERKLVVEEWQSGLCPVENNEEQETLSGLSSTSGEVDKQTASNPHNESQDSSTSAMKNYDALTREFDRISVATTWGSRRTLSMGSMCSSESTYKAVGITIKTPSNRTRHMSLLNRFRFQGSNSPFSRRKEGPILEPSISSPHIGKEGESSRKLSGEDSIRGQNAMNVPEPSPSPKGFRSYMKRSYSKGHADKPESPGLITLLQGTGGPPAPMIRSPPTEDPPSLSSLYSGLLHPGLHKKTEATECDEPASPSGSDISRGSNIAGPSSPTSEAFERYTSQKCPRIRPYLLKRVTDQQCRNSRRLMAWRHDHRVMGVGPGSRSNYSGAVDKRVAKRAGPQDSPKLWRVFRDGLPNEQVDIELSETTLTATFPRDVPLPPVSILPAVFDCPWCFKMLSSIKIPSDWTKHVLEDLHPYVCTFQDCTSSPLFKRKADWVRHESEKHRQLEWWECDVPGCDHICYRKDNFTQHLIREHNPQEQNREISHQKSNSASANSAKDTTARVFSCRRESDKHPSTEPCGFCNKRFDDWKKLIKHLAEHMEQISLPVLALVERTMIDGNMSCGTGEYLHPSDLEQEGSISGDASSFDPEKEGKSFGGRLPTESEGKILNEHRHSPTTTTGDMDQFQAKNIQTWDETQMLQTPDPRISQSPASHIGFSPNNQRINIATSSVPPPYTGGYNLAPQTASNPGLVNVAYDAWDEFINEPNSDLYQTESAPSALSLNSTSEATYYQPLSSYDENIAMSISPSTEGPPGLQAQQVYSTFPGPNPQSFHDIVPEFRASQSYYSNTTNHNGQPQMVPAQSVQYNAHQPHLPLFEQPNAYMQQELFAMTPRSPNQMQQQFGMEAMQNGYGGFAQPSDFTHPQAGGQNQQYYPDQSPTQYQNQFYNPYSAA